jgi:hypothetical protein
LPEVPVSARVAAVPAIEAAIVTRLPLVPLTCQPPAVVIICVVPEVGVIVFGPLQMIAVNMFEPVIVIAPVPPAVMERVP